jgi:predicted metal-dependent peptidase
MKHTLEMSRAISNLTCQDIFFTAMLYTLKIEAREDLPAAAATDGVHLYYHPERFAREFNNAERIFVLVHELLHVILFHPLRRGIRDPKRWNIACDHVVNLLCEEYKFTKPKACYCDPQYMGMTAEQVYNKLPPESRKQSKKGDKGLAGDIMDYDPTQNEGKPASEVERETAVSTLRAQHAAKAAGQKSGGRDRMFEAAQVQREPWHQHLRRYMTTMTAREYNWAKMDTKRAALHGVVAPRLWAEGMGKIVIWVDCSGSVSNKQLGAMGEHISDIAKQALPKEVVVGYFDSIVCHVDTFTGPDYHITLSPHGGGGTKFKPMFEYMQEHHTDAQVAIVFTDLHGSFGESNPVCDTLWVSQTETVKVPFGELIYGDLNEN